MCRPPPVSQHAVRPPSHQRAVLSPPLLPLSPRGYQGTRRCRARRLLRLVLSCPDSRRQTSPSPRRAVLTSVTACATTWTPTQPPPRHVRNTYACKTAASSLRKIAAHRGKALKSLSFGPLTITLLMLHRYRITF